MTETEMQMTVSTQNHEPASNIAPTTAGLKIAHGGARGERRRNGGNEKEMEGGDEREKGRGMKGRG